MAAVEVEVAAEVLHLLVLVAAALFESHGSDSQERRPR